MTEDLLDSDNPFLYQGEVLKKRAAVSTLSLVSALRMSPTYGASDPTPWLFNLASYK